MNDSAGALFGIVLIAIIWWAVHNHTENKIEGAFDQGYSDGYEDGQTDVSREDVTREEVKRNAMEYCSDYLDEFIAGVEEKFTCYPK